MFLYRFSGKYVRYRASSPGWEQVLLLPLHSTGTPGSPADEKQNREGAVNKIFIDASELQVLLFERRQIIALLENTELWRQIPLAQRFAIIDSSEFVTLMGESFTEHARRMLEDEMEAMVSTIH
jgi:hypothetical protein